MGIALGVIMLYNGCMDKHRKMKFKKWMVCPKCKSTDLSVTFDLVKPGARASCDSCHASGPLVTGGPSGRDALRAFCCGIRTVQQTPAERALYEEVERQKYLDFIRGAYETVNCRCSKVSAHPEGR